MIRDALITSRILTKNFMNDGWISLHRKVMENPLYFSEPFTRMQAWIDMLLLANHKGSFFYVRGNKVTVNRGEIGYSQQNLAIRWQWSRGKVIRFLNEIEKSGMIVQQKNSVNNIISIVKYDDYQQVNTTENTPDGQQTVQQTDRNNNDNNDNNKKGGDKKNENASENIKVYLELIPENWRESVEVWLMYKRERRELYKNEKSFKSFYKTVERESKGNPSVFQAAVEQSIKNNWAGVFPEKYVKSVKHPMIDHSNEKVYEEF